MERQPKLMDFSRIHDILEPHYEHLREHIYISKELGILHGDRKVEENRSPSGLNLYHL